MKDFRRKREVLDIVKDDYGKSNYRQKAVNERQL